MKSTQSAKKSENEVTAALEIVTKPAIERLLSQRPEFGPAVDWMKQNGCNPGRVVDAVLAKLSARGRKLPRDQRTKYVSKVVLGEFLARWAKKHHGTLLSQLQKDAVISDQEVRPFELAMMAIGEPGVFRKTLPRLARVKTVRTHGGELGNADDFSGFVMCYSRVLAHRFLSRFDPSVQNAPAKAVKYLEMAAVSHYLHDGVKVEWDRAGLSRHLRKSTRLNSRTKLAAKLVYLPSLLTKKERALLRRKYQLTGSLVKRMRVKDVAALFGYPTPNTLSRKLYRLRGWIEEGRKNVVEAVEGKVKN